MRRVVVTGLGMVSPLGNTVEESWQGVKEGRSGIGPITYFDTEGYDCKIAGQLKDFDVSKWIDKKEARKMAKFTQYAAVASVQALEDAGLNKDNIESDRTSILLGNGIGGFEVIENSMKKYFEAGPSRMPPLTVPMMITNEAPGNISMLFGIKGTAHSLATACASSTDALGVALDQVRSGRCDVCLAGGTEAAIVGFGIGGFSVLKTLATSYNDNPEKASRPFDSAREGFVMGEGAAILILEEYEHAKKRGAKIYCEFAGYGGSSDAYHITSPDPSGEGGAAAMIAAMKDAGVKPEDVQYYNAHGTSTPINDPSETAMIKKAFGEHAYNMKISSTKSMTGHCLGAAGAIEAVFCIKAMEEGFYPPTINLDNVDLEHGCDLDYVPNKGVKGEINCAASGSLGFGGHNGVVIFKKIK
ncbi:MAG: beta-ketoacyl-[acyl-carrier-protein] synthase II [Spirochaetaceae bacterium]|nr:beta-ketoacyl-[acyl-carrier-protein] synthase II [Spirochaetaceae bacterium]